MGEAAAVLVLEELEHARARGARIYGEFAGYGVSADAAHMTEPDPTGANPARAMRMAMDDAGVDASEVGYINAHATSTPLGDASETRVIKLALGEENALRTPVSSTKAQRDIASARPARSKPCSTLAVYDRKVPPTIQLRSQTQTAISTTSRTSHAKRRICALRSRTRSVSADTTQRLSSAVSTRNVVR
jgi:3-oxoacyl-[acyl-carrier-protein] synthase II